MMRKCIIAMLASLTLVGCETHSKLALNQSKEKITTKPKVRLLPSNESNETVSQPMIDYSANMKETEPTKLAYGVITQKSENSQDKEKDLLIKPKSQPTSTTVPKKVSEGLTVASDKDLDMQNNMGKAIPQKKLLPTNAFTIQVIALKDNQGFQHYIQQLSKDNPMWLNEKKVNGDAAFALLYGEFATMEEAQSELKSLPKNFIDYGAFVRSFSAIKKSKFPKLEPVFR